MIFHVEDQNGSYNEAHILFEGRSSITVHTKTSVNCWNSTDNVGSTEEVFLQSTPL